MNDRQRRWERVLVTGAAGFIGSHLVEHLVSQGQHVTGMDDLSTGCMQNIQHLLDHPRFAFVRADVCDRTVMNGLARDVQGIVHLAAAVGVKLIVERPVQTIETNVTGTIVVLEAGLRYGCQTLIASTSEVYGKGTAIPFSEDDDIQLGPTSRSRWAYAASKMVDEFLGLAYHREYGLPVTLFRLFNTVGPRQTGRYGMVLPTFVRQALAGEPITVFGNGEQRRCFCHVADVVNAIDALATTPGAVGRVFNIGGSEEVTILELANRVRERSGASSATVMVPYDQAYGPGFEDMHRRVPSCNRIEQLTGWSTTRSLNDMIDDVIAFERARQ